MGRSPPTADGRAGLHNTHLCEGRSIPAWCLFLKNKHSTLVVVVGNISKYLKRHHANPFFKSPNLLVEECGRTFVGFSQRG